MENRYELLYIVSIKHIEDELQKVRDAVKSLLEKNEAKIELDEIFSKQKLAYPIKHIHQGTYVVVEFVMPRANLLEVEKQLKLMPEILRHMVIKKRVKSADELDKEKRFAEKLKQEQEARREKEEKDEAKPKKSKPAAKKDKTADVEVKEKPGKEKASLEELDEKLDEILSKDVMK